MTLLSEDVRVRIGRREIVYGADLHLDAGVLGLLGPNGAGKTTLLRTLATALLPFDGRLELFGIDIRRNRGNLREVRRRIGYAPQLPLVLRHLSVYDQVAYAAWLKGMDSKDQRIMTALEQVALAERFRDRTRKLSGGLLRRLGIAMALVSEPDLLLLDEPTAGLDPEQRVQFRKLVTEIGKERAVVLSTHLIEDVAAVCTTIAVMTGGRTTFRGTPGDLAGRAEDSGMEGHSAIEAGFISVTGIRRP